MWPRWCHRRILQKLFQSQPWHLSTRTGSVAATLSFSGQRFLNPSFGMGWSYISPPRGARVCPEPDKYHQISWRQLRQTLPKWWRPGLCNGRRLPGPPRSTWSLSRMVPGGPVEIFITWKTSLRPISIPCPTSKIFRASCRAHWSFTKLTCSGVITRFPWPGRTSTKQRSLHHLASTSFCGPSSG